MRSVQTNLTRFENRGAVVAKIEDDEAKPLAIAIGVVVCEPQINRTPFVVIEPGETVGTVLVAPLDPRKRRNRTLWYYAFIEDLERWSTEEGD